MQDLFNIILPVFLVIGIGYLGTRRNYITGEQIDGLVKYTQNFAIPFLLFTAIARLDLEIGRASCRERVCMFV